MSRFSGYIFTVRFLTVMVLTVIGVLAVGPKFSFELELSSSDLARYHEVMTKLANTLLLHISSYHHVKDLNLFCSLCFLIPPLTG